MKTLKTITILASFIFSIVCFSSCSDNDDNQPQIIQEQIVGTWDVVRISVDGKHLNLTDGEVRIRLYNDNTYRVKFFSNSYTGTYTINGNTVTGITSDPITERFSFINLDGDVATIDYTNSDGDHYTFQTVHSQINASL